MRQGDVVEMTGDFSLTPPVMLAVAIATAVSRALSYGTIYTTKLLRRGSDIDQAAPWRALRDLKVTERHEPHTLFASESLAQALRQLEVYGRDGLPVLSPDGHHVEGWITSATVLRPLARQISGARTAEVKAQAAAGQDRGEDATPGEKG